MGNLSAHISRGELACKCGCGFDPVDAELMAVVEECVTHFEQLRRKRLRVWFTSGNRCPAYNATIPGAAEGSFHTKGLACDFVIEGVSADAVADYLEDTYPTSYGIGRYTGRTHLDVRASPARWDLRQPKEDV